MKFVLTDFVSKSGYIKKKKKTEAKNFRNPNNFRNSEILSSEGSQSQIIQNFP